MKTPNDPRHQHRINRMQKLFSYAFTKRGDEDIQDIVPVLTDIDTHIAQSAPEWPLDKIARIDLAVLRLAVWELLYDKSQPTKVVIDEAVELSKSFGNEHSGKFVNGVLGTIAKIRDKQVS